MKYTLETSTAPGKAVAKKSTLGVGVRRFLPLMKPEAGLVIVALAAMLISTCTALVGPVIIGRGIDTYVRFKDNRGLLLASVVLMAIYLVGWLPVTRKSGPWAAWDAGCSTACATLCLRSCKICQWPSSIKTRPGI
jgi:hypothetical protein